MERFREWTGLKSDLTNYRLNSSILMTRSASLGTANPSSLGPSQGVRPTITSSTLQKRIDLLDAIFQMETFDLQSSLTKIS
jgi:hypothetical protein